MKNESKPPFLLPTRKGSPKQWGSYVWLKRRPKNLCDAHAFLLFGLQQTLPVLPQAATFTVCWYEKGGKAWGWSYGWKLTIESDGPIVEAMK